MIEPLYGPNVSMWSGLPPQGFSLLSMPFAVGGRAAGAGTPGFTTQSPIAQAGMSSQGLPGTTQASGFFTPQGPAGSIEPAAYQQFGSPGLVPALAGPDVMTGPTARTLVALVAMRRGQPAGPTNDQEIEELIFDTLDMLLGASEVEVRCEGSRVTLSGNVAHKRLKRDVGEIAWAIPGVSDVTNTVTIVGRRRARAARESEPVPAGKKPAA